ncbi:MAG: response regulator transcription factor [Herpetosiphonaceae bacterium]|nr:response regulator transcription factor [Herpetosiphonaceae bacterium]
MTNSLDANGFRQEATASILVLVDAPQGSALRELEHMDSKGQQIVVTTHSPCPEYWEDLWSLQPAILLVGDSLGVELHDAIKRAAHGERYRSTPGSSMVLTDPERVMFRYIARGWSLDRLAEARGVSSKTVSNMITIICEKLGLPDRHAAMLYYWGRLDLLD